MSEPSVAPDIADVPLVLVADVGTSSARAQVYDAQGRSLAGCEAHRPYSLRTSDDGAAVVDPKALLDLTLSCIDEVLARVRAHGLVVNVVACDTFWHSLIGLARDCEPLTPVLTWVDTRSATAASELRELLNEDDVHARTGCMLHSSYLPAKIRWLTTTQPEVASRINRWISFAEYLFFRLFGEFHVSVSMASGTGLFDQNECAWDRNMLAALDIPESMLSPIDDYSSPLVGLQEPFRSRWPELATIPWYLPLGDGACNNIGSGGTGDDQCVLMIGTSGALRVVREASRVSISPGLWTYRVDLRRFVQGGALSEGGNVYAWLRHSLNLPDERTLEHEVGALPPDGHGLTVLPFFAGERSPHWNPDARAAFTGLGLDTTPVEIVRAAYESVAYSFGSIFATLQHDLPSPRGIIGSGVGLVHSPVWMQIVCDVLGEPMSMSAVPEATGRGAALLALQAMGEVDDLTTLPAPLGPGVVPNLANHSIYQRAAARREKLSAALSALLQPPTSTQARPFQGE